MLSSDDDIIRQIWEDDIFYSGQGEILRNIKNSILSLWVPKDEGHFTILS